MTSVAERKRNRRESRKVAPPPRTEAANQNAPKAKPKRQGGIEWLIGKKRVSPRQAAAGKSYGIDARLASISGLSPLRSCLNDDPRGGNGGGQPFVVYETEAQNRYALAQASLSYHPGMIAALDLICVRDLTPWEALPEGTQRDVEKLQNTLVIALDLLVTHYRLTNN